MPQDLDFALYFNIAFFSALGLGALFGFLKGLKKSLWGFVVTLIFFAFFFLTINAVVAFLWEVNLPFLGGVLANVSPALSSVTKLSEALPILLNEFLGGELDAVLTNANVMAFLTSLALFVLKIVYTILYFTVIQIIYRLILWIVRMIVFPSRKKTDKYKSKNRGLGALVGLASGAISLYVTLIIFGGLISISESMTTLLPEPEPQTLSYVEFRSEFNLPTDTLIPLAETTSPLDDPMFQDAFNMLNEMVDAYNTNIVVSTQNQLTMTSPYSGEEMPLNLYLFDEVLSMEYQEETIAFREEISVLAEAGEAFLSSEYFETQEIQDLEGDEIRVVFNALANSNLITSLLPVGIEVAADYLDTDVEVPTEELYAISWDTELSQLGEIAGTAFDLINAAGILNPETDLTTVTLEGDDVQDLFEELGDSELVTLSAYVAMAPILEMAGSEVQSIVGELPADMNWSDEFDAIGALAGSVLNAGLTMGAVESGDLQSILTILADIDFTILLDSKIITNAMINILSGNVASIDVSFLSVPAGLDWETELENILLAINALSASLPGLDLENPSLTMISQLTANDINSLFESQILVATITDYISELPLGDFEIIIPDSALDPVTDYILKTELQNIVNAVFMLVEELECPVGDTECEEIGIDVGAILTLDGDNIDTLLLSEVLAASAGNLIITMASDVLTIPASALSEITVDDVGRDVVSKQEIKNAFLAISTLGITDYENITFDLSIISNLGTAADPTILDQDKADLLFASSVLNATLSTYLLDFADEQNVIVVPYQDQDGVDVREVDAVDGTVYISQEELTHILEAVLVIDLQDINNVDTLDLGLILDNAGTLLNSAILHATVSKQLLDFDDVIVVPTNDILGNPIRITTGPVGHETTFIDKTEIESAIDALSVLGISDINNVTIDATILTNLATDADPTILDTTKSDRLFSSTIINATLSKYILDLTSGDTSVIVVPEEDQDGVTILSTDATDGTQYISEAELTNILEAVLALDIQDFNTVDSLGFDLILDNVSTLLDSAILHATVSKQLLDLDVVVVPTNDELGNPVRVPTDPLGQDTIFISKTELENAFNALEVLGITDIAGVGIDLTILENVATDADPTVLDQAKADVLFASAIINATISKYIIDFTEGDNPFIVVPYKSELNADITIIDPTDGVKIITQDELTNILEAILILDLQDFNNVENLSLTTITDNASTILDSSILQATISKQLLDLTDVIVVPSVDELDNPVKVTQGDPGFETTYITRDQLIATFDALAVLGITDINNAGIDMTILDNLALESDATELDPVKADTLFGSAIINATLSDYITDFSSGDDPFLVTPYQSEDGTTVMNYLAADDINIITEAELTNVLKAILKLNLSDFNEVDTMALDTIINNMDTLLDSAILHASISKQLIDLGADIVVIPQYHTNDTLLQIPQGTITYIQRLELENTFDALQVLGITDINNVGVDITILNNLGTELDPTILDPAKSAMLFSSTIMKATVSKYIIDFGQEGSGILTVPYQDELGTDIREETIDNIQVFTQTELNNVLAAILALNLTDFNQVDGLSMATLIEEKDTILESVILQATISTQLIDLGTGILIIPEKAEDNSANVLITVGAVAEEETTFIVKDELDKLLEVLNVLNMGDIDDFGGAIDLSLLDTPEKVNTLVSSSIIQATISDQILAMEDDTGSATTVIIPYKTDIGDIDLRTTVGVNVFTEMIVQSELKDLVEAFIAFGFTDVSDLSGAITISTLADNAATMFESYIIQATVTKQVVDLASAEIVIPFYDDGGTQLRYTTGPIGDEVEFIIKGELENLMLALDVLVPEGSGVDSFTGTIDVSLFYDVTSRTTLLDSSILQASISKQLLDMGDAALEIPQVREDKVTAVQVSHGLGAELSEYIVKDEIHAIFEALELLGLDDITDFDGSTLSFATFMPSGSVDYDANQDVLLASASIQATISTQIIELRTSGTITIPTHDDSDTEVNFLVSGTEYITVAEIKHLFNALDVLGFDISDFDGTLGLTALFPSQDIDYDSNQNTLLASAIMHATVTKQINDLDGGTIIVPATDISDTSINVAVTGYTYLLKTEIKALLNGMDKLGFSGNLDGFDGNVNFSALSSSSAQDTLLASVILHATISDQISGLSGTQIILPTTDDLDQSIQTTTLTSDFYITKTEIKALLDAMNVLGIGGNLAAFDGNISLGNLFASVEPVDYSTNQDTVLASAIMHATITDQIKNDLGATALVVPDTDIDGIAIDTTVSTNYFLLKTEIKHLIDALDVVGFNGNLTTFGGALDLGNLSTTSNQDTFLLSAIMHATVSDQINDLNGTQIVMPSTDVSDTAIHTTVSGTFFVTKTEVKALLDAMNVLGIGGNLAAFDGNIGLGNLFASVEPVDYADNQDTVLASAIMHATITDQIKVDLSSALVVPTLDVTGTAIDTTVSTNFFILKTEIKALIDALDVIGFSGNLGGFDGTIDLGNLATSNNQDTLLLSAIMHATISDKLLEEPSNTLVIPDTDINTATTLRITQGGTAYIEKNETKALISALNALGLTDTTQIDITPAKIFDADFTTLLASASMQATISSKILSGALDDSAAAGSGKLIVPNYFREQIFELAGATEWIEKDELEDLLYSLDVLDIQDFSGSVGGSTVTNMTGGQLDTLLGSGSMQVTIDNMLKGNANINTKIPDLAQEDVYNMTNITTKAEIKAFILATQQIGAGDITNVTFSTAVITSMTPAQRDIALDSMIVRNMLTDELEASMLADDPLDTYWPANSDYMNSDPSTFLTEAGINNVLTHYGLI